MVVVEILNFALVAQLAMLGALVSIHVFMWKYCGISVSVMIRSLQRNNLNLKMKV
jgi:hypothetical protein